MVLTVPPTSLILILLTPFTLPYIDFQKFITETHNLYMHILYSTIPILWTFKKINLSSNILTNLDSNSGHNRKASKGRE